MAERSDLLERLRVASPCTASWAAMDGDDRVRFCRQCGLHVYNLSEMTRGEAEALVRRTEGRPLCARLYRRADGTVITRDCPAGLRALRRRLTRRAAAALAAALALAGGAFGQRPGPDEGPRQQKTDADGFTYTLKRGAAKGAGSTFKGKVLDPAGAVIAGADVLLYIRGKRKPYAGMTSDEGLFQVKGLPPGTYIVEIYSYGFRRFKLEKLSVVAGESVEIELVLPLDPERTLINPTFILGRLLPVKEPGAAPAPAQDKRPPR